MGRVIRNILETMDIPLMQWIDELQISRWLLIAGGSVLLIIIIHIRAWYRIKFYSRLMDRNVRELWNRIELDVDEKNLSPEVKKIRTDRLKDRYHHRIQGILRKRNRILKAFFILRLWYKIKEGRGSPGFTFSE